MINGNTDVFPFSFYNIKSSLQILPEAALLILLSVLYEFVECSIALVS